MITIGWYILIFAAVRLLISFMNWACHLYLPEAIQSESVPFVSVLIPARNEEHNLPNILDDLMKFKYPSMEIIVYDDQSTDQTAAVVQRYTAHLRRLQLIRGGSPEEGWLGKNYACHQLAQVAGGEIFLFLDADVRVNDGLMEKAISYMQKHQLGLLSIFPQQIMPTIDSRMSVPIMNWILLSLLFLPLIRITSLQSFSAANGQFMLFDAGTYRSIQPHKQCRHNRVEDIAIVKLFKKHRQKRATLLGTDDIRCLMYHTLREAVDGFSKNVFQFFGGSRILTVLFAAITTLGSLWVFLFNGFGWGMLYVFIIILIRLFTSLASHQAAGRNILLALPQQFVFLRIITKALIASKQKNMQWKGRNISD